MAKVKVREFANFDAFHESGIAGEYEIVTVVPGHNTVCADLMTECKHYKTAINRFFKALNGDPRFDGWKECLSESCESGLFSEAETTDAGYVPGGYHWLVECLDENLYYIELTVPMGEGVM